MVSDRQKNVLKAAGVDVTELHHQVSVLICATDLRHSVQQAALHLPLWMRGQVLLLHAAHWLVMLELSSLLCTRAFCLGSLFKYNLHYSNILGSS